MVNFEGLVTVLRHGEVKGPPNVLRGRSNPPLSENGWRQMRQAVHTLDTPIFTALSSSPLTRCLAFAETLAAELGLALNILPDLREMDFGEWEELTPQQAQALDPVLFGRFQANPAGITPPRGEPFDAFYRRVTAAFDAWLAGLGGGHALLITHAGVMRVLLAQCLGLPIGNLYRIALPAAGGFQLSLLPGHPPCLLSLNGS